MTSIQWTSKTWNPVRGCTRVSEGCRHCYAETFAARNLPEMRSPTTGEPFAVRTAAGPRWTGKVELIQSALDKPLRWRKPQRIFVNSMSDLFHESLPNAAIDEVFAIMALAPRHTFQILTKRPERMRDYMLPIAGLRAIGRAWERLGHMPKYRHEDVINRPWPLPNVWLGTSVEDQATADQRIPLLLQTPAALRFVSYEPALGPQDVSKWLRNVWACNKCGQVGPAPNAARAGGHQHEGCRYFAAVSPGLDWIIVGGESGPGARPFDVAWARSTVAQCKAAGVAVFVKQLGAHPIDPARIHAEPRLPGDTIRGEATPEQLDRLGELCELGMVRLHDRKGGDMAEWPEDLRIREFPRSLA